MVLLYKRKRIKVKKVMFKDKIKWLIYNTIMHLNHITVEDSLEVIISMPVSDVLDVSDASALDPTFAEQFPVTDVQCTVGATV